MPLQGTYTTHPADWTRDHVEQIVATGTTDKVEFLGYPIVLVTMRGARSGKLHRMPLMRVEHDGCYAIVASKGGEPDNPLWYHNLKANPQVELQDRDVTRDYVAREASGAERAEWWERAVAAYPPYAEYQTRTDRVIPVFVLDRLA
jgi:deazaflavin-dependent oxidoreductase (nitroreductase family)